MDLQGLMCLLISYAVAGQIRQHEQSTLGSKEPQSTLTRPKEVKRIISIKVGATALQNIGLMFPVMSLDSTYCHVCQFQVRKVEMEKQKPLKQT